MKPETKCLQSGYKPENGQPRTMPIYQSTTYKYDSSTHLGDLFDLKAAGHMYSRISNPTVACVEEKIKTTTTVVSSIPDYPVNVERCEVVAKSLGAKFRAREFIVNGY